MIIGIIVVIVVMNGFRSFTLFHISKIPVPKCFKMFQVSKCWVNSDELVPHESVWLAPGEWSEFCQRQRDPGGTFRWGTCRSMTTLAADHSSTDPKTSCPIIADASSILSMCAHVSDFILYPCQNSEEFQWILCKIPSTRPCHGIAPICTLAMVFHILQAVTYGSWSRWCMVNAMNIPSKHSHYIILYHIISYYLILSHFISYYFIWFHILSFYFILRHIISYYLILYHIISCYLILSHVISYYLIVYHIISCYLILSHSIS